jgi:uncharacterized protein (DUF1778 family)
MSHTVLLDQTHFSLNSEQSKALLADLLAAPQPW